MTSHSRPFRHSIAEINHGMIFKTKPDAEKEHILFLHCRVYVAGSIQIVNSL